MSAELQIGVDVSGPRSDPGQQSVIRDFGARFDVDCERGAIINLDTLARLKVEMDAIRGRWLALRCDLLCDGSTDRDGRKGQRCEKQPPGAHLHHSKAPTT